MNRFCDLIRNAREAIVLAVQYRWQRFHAAFLYAPLGLLLVLIQAAGFEWITKEIIHWQALVAWHWLARGGIFFVLAVLLNVLLFEAYFHFALRQDAETVHTVNRFLRCSLSHNDVVGWYFCVRILVSRIVHEERVNLWLTAREYMRMHVAAALLARRYYYSLFEPSGAIWRILRKYGGIEYGHEVKAIHLKHGERYVVVNGVSGCVYADPCTDFAGANGLRIRCVSKENAKGLGDFSAFDLGSQFLIIRICDKPRGNDTRVARHFDDIARRYRSEDQDQIRAQLDKKRFKVTVQIVDAIEIAPDQPPIPKDDVIQNTLQKLRNSCERTRPADCKVLREGANAVTAS